MKTRREHSSRAKILRLLGDSDVGMSFGELNRKGLVHNRGTLSRHLKNLEKEGLIEHKRTNSSLTIAPHIYNLTERARLNRTPLIMLEERLASDSSWEPTPEILQDEISDWEKQAKDPANRRTMLQAMLGALSERYGTEQTLRDRASQIRGIWIDTNLPNPPRIAEIEAIYKSWRQHGMVKETRSRVSLHFNRREIMRGGRILTHLAYGLVTGELPKPS